MTTSAARPAEYAALTARREAAGGRYRLVLAMRGMGWFLLVVVPVVVGVLFVAGTFSPPAWVNGLLIACMLGAVGVGYAAFLHGALF